jgi:GntR family transcriptional regulator
VNIDALSSEPLYRQIQQILMAEIRQGRYEASGRLPSERELSERFGVSRMTARQAVQGLCQESWVYSQVGRGTYVRRQPFQHSLGRLISFSEDMRAAGITPSSRVLQAKTIRSDEDIAARLSIEVGSRVVELRRLRLANQMPVAVDTCYLVDALCPGLLDGHDFSRESLFHVLRHDYGLALARADQTIRAGIASDEEADLLGIRDDLHPLVLHLNRVTYSSPDWPVEYSSSVYRGTFYEFHVSLNGTGARITVPSATE